MQSPKKSSNKIIVIIILVAIIVIGIVFVLWRTLNSDNKLKPTQPAVSSYDNPEQSETAPASNSQLPEQLPAKHQLNVAFTPQAPTANWDELHNEACEEASAIMAYAYFNNITSLPPSLVESEITKLTNWQQQTYGYNLSITTAETKNLIESVYSLQVTQSDMNEQLIKQALVNNQLVILPAAGRLLGNPNFRAPGPLYHMLVITGYDETGFITNDPGTRKGLSYKYSYASLYKAAGSYSHQTKLVDTDIKQLLIISA